MADVRQRGSVTAQEFRTILGHLPTAVVVVTATDGQGPIGMTVGTFASVSLDPMLVGFLPANDSGSWARIRAAGSFCANVLGSGQVELCNAFAARTGHKFDGLTWRTAASGSPVLPGVVAWIDCDIESVHPAGDHAFVLGAVRELGVEQGDAPLVFHRGAFGGVHHPPRPTTTQSVA